MANMYGHCIVRAICLFFPDLFINLIDGKDLAFIFYKKQQDIVLNPRQLHRFSVHGNLFSIIVDHKSAGRIYLLRCFLPCRTKVRVAADL